MSEQKKRGRVTPGPSNRASAEGLREALGSDFDERMRRVEAELEAGGGVLYEVRDGDLVPTDRASAEGLRAAAQEVVDAWDASVVNLDVEPAIEALRATLRSSESDSGIDGILTPENERDIRATVATSSMLHMPRWTDHQMGLVLATLDAARLSTPRTETSELPTCHECGARFVPPRTETSEG